jgi:hypothetical protein
MRCRVVSTRRCLSKTCPQVYKRTPSFASSCLFQCQHPFPNYPSRLQRGSCQKWLFSDCQHERSSARSRVLHRSMSHHIRLPGLCCCQLQICLLQVSQYLLQLLRDHQLFLRRAARPVQRGHHVSRLLRTLDGPRSQDGGRVLGLSLD